jgi:hypothetical protein
MAKKKQTKATRKRGIDDTYLGHSGQMAVMSELLLRKCNVSKPDVDEGTDVFAFLEDRPEVVRIQVKSAKAVAYKEGGGYHAQFDIPMAQMGRDHDPPLFYVLAANLDGNQVSFLIISRVDMRGYWNGTTPFGTENARSGNLVLTVRYREKILSQQVELTRYQNAWNDLPPLKPRSAPTLQDQGVGVAPGAAGGARHEQGAGQDHPVGGPGGE